MTARQIWEEFEEQNISIAVKQAYDDESTRDTSRFQVINAVLPNPDSSASGLPWKFLDVYYLQSSKEDPNQFLRLSGFEEKPFGAPRWEPFDVYGTSPAIDVYPDAKQLNIMEQELVKAIHKHVNPPMLGPTDLDVTPNAINAHYDDASQNIRPVFAIAPDIQGTLLKVEKLESMIKKGLFIDLFQSILSAPDIRMTATEVQARREDGLFALGTVIERLSNEALDPILDRVFRILLQKGLIPEPPEELQGQELKVEYTSILSQAQKAGALVSIERFLAFIQTAAASHPDIVDSFNFDAAADEASQTIPAKLVNDMKEREVIRVERARQKALALQAEAAKQGAENLSKVADADSKDSEVVNEVLR